MAYSDKVVDHYNNPRNVGSFGKDTPGVGTGLVGAPECGDVMKLQIKVNVETGIIEDAKFKTFGCGSAIASSSLATEWLKGRTVDEAAKIKNTDIVSELKLPPEFPPVADVEMTEGEIERFREIMEGTVEGVDFVEGSLARGFCFPAANLVVLSAAELFGRFAVHPRRLLRLRRAERHRAQIDFSELAEGDLVVHLEHGVGRFLGLEKFPVGQAHRLPRVSLSLATKKASDALALQNLSSDR